MAVGYWVEHPPQTASLRGHKRVTAAQPLSSSQARLQDGDRETKAFKFLFTTSDMVKLRRLADVGCIDRGRKGVARCKERRLKQERWQR